MVKSNKNADYLRFNHLTSNDEKLTREFIKNPSKTLKKLGISEDSINCPKEAHLAFERAEKLADNIASLDSFGIKDLPRIENEVEKIFGKDYVIKKQPFGLQFSEKTKLFGDFTATGSGTITFGLDTDADVDG